MASEVALEITLLLSVAFVGYILAALSRQSVVIGEILVGVVVGPSLLGWVQVDAFVQGLGLVGAIVLLFLSGLGHRFEDLFRPRYALIALAGVVVPWAGGYLFALASGFSSTSALFIGTSLTATSIAITASVLTELGVLHSAAGKAILGAAVIDDVLGLLALAITVQSAGGGIQVGEVALLAFKAVAFLFIGAIVGRRVIQRAMERLDTSSVGERHPEVVFFVAINAAFLYAAVAELIGLSAIVGAFLAGISLDTTKRMRTKGYKEGTEYLSTIFASFFFVSLGVLVDVRQVLPSAVPFILALTALAMATKLIGCALPARLMRLSWADSLLVGIGMAPRGEVALIVALIALQAGVVGQDVYAAVVMTSLLTTLATPPLMRWAAARSRAAVSVPHSA